MSDLGQWTSVDHTVAASQTAAQVGTQEDRPYQIKVNCKRGALCASVEANIQHSSVNLVTVSAV